MDYNVILFIRDITTIALLWAVMGSAYYVWGHYLYNYFTLKTEETDAFFSKIWLGWGFSIVFFCIWHFFFPINWIGSVIFYIPTSFAFAVYHRQTLCRVVIHGKLVVIFIAIVMTLTGLWASVQEQCCQDSGFYHLNTLRWFNEYAIVPGLGNVHTRLGFNQLNFVNCASINFYPFLKYPGSHAGTAFLLVLLILNCIFNRKGIDCLIPMLFCFIPIQIIWLSSPTTDWVLAFLQIVAFRYFYIALDKKFAEQKEYSYVSIAAILAALSVVVKLNSAFFALGLGAITLFLALKNKLNDESARQLKKVFSYIGILTCLWIVRGYILTGCPLFPSTIGKINFEWAVDDKYAKIAEDSVYVFARLENYELGNEDVNDNKWIKLWWTKRIESQIENYKKLLCNEDNLSFVSAVLRLFHYGGIWSYFLLSVVFLDGIGAFLFIMGITNCIFKKKFVNYMPIVLVVLLTLICMIIWFWIAPAERFLAGMTLIFFMSCVSLFAKSFNLKLSSDTTKYVMCMVPTISILVCYPIVSNKPLPVIDSFRQPAFSVIETTDSGINVTLIRDLRWTYDYYLISTFFNEYNPSLRMLGSTYQDGFAGK